MLCLLLPLPSLASDPPAPSDDYHRGLDLTGWPVASYRDEHGWILGAYGDLIDYGAGGPLYDWRVQAQAVVSSRWTQDYFVRLDLPGIFSPALRLFLLAGYTDIPEDRYFGVGNAARWSRSWEDPSSASFRDERYTFFRLRRPWSRIQARVALSPAFALIGAAQLQWDLVAPEAGTLLHQDAPNGARGGRHGFVTLGALIDTRDQEASPRRGTLSALTFRTGGPIVGGDRWFVGATLTARAYLELVHTLVLATRASLDGLAGDVPFLELAAFRGYLPFQGLGGGSSLRGYPRRRFVGPLKLLTNVELRWTPLVIHLWNQRFDLGAVAFCDGGRVWSHEDDGSLDWLGLHATTGGGLRFSWDENAVMRGDLGVSSEGYTIDLVLGHMF